jgi:uridylate kinase
MKFHRILLKLSGEALKWDQDYGIDVNFTKNLAEKVGTLHRRGVQIAIVFGGGNIFRGMSGEKMGLDRVAGDYMGMLATVMNGVAFADLLTQMGIPNRVMTSVKMEAVAESFIQKRALKHLELWRVVICVAGTGNPYCTTDSAAVLKALELKCDVMIKGSKVDGIYNKDPKHHDDAVRFEELTLEDAIKLNIKVMDQGAIGMARDEGLPLFVCHIDDIDLIGTQEVKGTKVRA